MNKYILIVLIFIGLISCSKPEARKPIVRKTSSFMNESIDRNKSLNELENNLLNRVMKLDSLHQYINSENGFWYYYNERKNNESDVPRRGDEVFFNHEIRNVNDSIYYAKEVLGTRSYLVDKEELITGLQDGIKLMKEGEIVTFLFPSHKAFGYTGFEKIKPNEPVIYTVELIKINKLSENESN